MPSQLAPVQHGRKRVATMEDLAFAWRAAFDEESVALEVWSEGTGTYEAFVAATDREEAAAQALARAQGGNPL